jgi:two-component system nitrate/nitrite response regulator NarL
VDDHRRVLDTVSAMLADEFDVVGATTEGRAAPDLARRVDPDVVVLDVDMPGLNGFQTLRALQQSGSQATPVVFLSMHDADDVISEAFRCGGRGYVLKSRVARDLPSAIDQVLLGRVFVPSLTSLFHLANGGGHAMQLHAGVESLLDGVAAFFDLALRRGDATCVIATPRVREGLSARLRARGWDAGGPSGHKRYLALDAADGLNRFMRNGFPDRDQLALIAVELDQFRRAVAGATSRLTVFGNMVAALSVEGHAEAVIAVERLWNTLTHDLPCFTLCGYPTTCFHSRVPDLWSGVCTEHWALSHASDV